MKGLNYMDKSKIRQLADYAVRQCCENSENCYWPISYDELYHHFGVEITDSNESAKLLEKELRQREEINELIIDRGLHRNDLPSEILPTVSERPGKPVLRPRL